jgi:hypothetical protein
MAQPTEIDTLTRALDDMRSRGFTAQFTVADGGLRTVEGGPIFHADQVTILERRRFEGVSDPDDMAVLYGLQTHTGLRGTLTDAFGTYADPEIGAFMSRVAVSGGTAEDAADPSGHHDVVKTTRGRRRTPSPPSP